MSDDGREPVFRLTPEQRNTLSARVEEARANSRVAAARCALLLAATEVHANRTDAALEASREITGELEQTVREYARVLRQFDTPPDQALLLVKEAVAFEMPVLSSASRRVMEDVARWCIDAYYTT